MAVYLFDEMWEAKGSFISINDVAPIFDKKRPDLFTIDDAKLKEIQARLNSTLGLIKVNALLESRGDINNSLEYKNFKRSVGAQKHLLELSSLVREQSEDFFKAISTLCLMYKNFLDMEK